jgi:hypothetical protein
LNQSIVVEGVGGGAAGSDAQRQHQQKSNQYVFFHHIPPTDCIAFVFGPSDSVLVGAAMTLIFNYARCLPRWHNQSPGNTPMKLLY